MTTLHFQDGREVSALSETIKDETHEQESELTVTPTEDTTYTCTVTDASFGKTPTEATLNVFGKFLSFSVTKFS